MQKFGLQRSSHSTLNAIEAEIVKEQASSLGRAGKKLRLSLERYEECHRLLNEDELAPLLAEISNNVWELMLQREFVGFIEGNLNWVIDNYKIPEQALKQHNLSGGSA